MTIHPERLRDLNTVPEQAGDRVVYWMQQSQRVHGNHALAHAVDCANRHERPLLVVFGLCRGFPEANLRHYTFLLEGLAGVARDLRDRGIGFVVRSVPQPFEAVLPFAADACLVVTDRGYLRCQRQWRQALAEALPCRLVQVESDAVVPVDTAMDREAYMAASIRPRIQRHLDRFLVPVELPPIQRGWNPPVESDVDLGRPEATARDLGVDTSVLPVDDVHGGAIAARERLDRLISHRLVRYADDRNTPGSGIQSGLSPYLHFGQISPLEVALAVRNADAVSETARAAFLEELIVRRELALNFTERNPRYDQYEGLPEWARESLAEHANDPRESMYDRETLCEARTHDPFWNAAQREMLETGTMHGYMRMYWGKKILEWSATPEQAFETALWLNNRYELDGRDPNGFAGVAWCFGKHDRGWPERPVFGKIRYMNANGLRRKFDMAPYLARFSGP